MLSCSIWFSAPSFWMGGVLQSRCVCRVYGADGAVQHHPHRTTFTRGRQPCPFKGFKTAIRKKRAASEPRLRPRDN